MKTEEDLRKSRESRERIISELGQVPESIMVHNKSVKALDLMAEDRNYKMIRGQGGHHANRGHKSGRLEKCFEICGVGPRGGRGKVEDSALSRFPQNVGRTLLLLYTKKGDTVFDPFAGHNSRMELCFRAGRNYFGNDLSSKFMNANRRISEILKEKAKSDMFPDDFKATITLTEGDSKKLPMKSATGDFTITSPPYWDIEHYGDEPEQLGTGKTYEDFLSGLQQVARENYRVLKNGAFCVWCINDFRKGGRFYSYHEDTAQILRNAGFTQWDICITDLGTSIRAAFAQQVIETKILPKRHEYCLIFKKIIKPPLLAKK